jgi:penicillin-binding protein 1A
MKALLKFIKILLLIGLAAVLLGAGTFGAVYIYFSRDLPKISKLDDYRPPIITSVHARDGLKIAEFYRERRKVIPLSDMPPQLIQAFVAAEDARFYIHEGIDFYSILRAFIANLTAGGIVQGGSTITQQVTKSFLLTPERSYQRKIKEAILAYRIDKEFTKEQILYLYLNQIYLGHGAYGVEAAAENYFGKSVKELSLAECAILAGLPQAPSRYSPFRFPERAKTRQIYVLNRMLKEAYISGAEAEAAIEEALDITGRRNLFAEKVPHYTEHVRRELIAMFGEDSVYADGYTVYTTVDVETQAKAQNAIEKGLRDLDKRQGYRGPEDRVPPEQIETVSRELEAAMALSPPQTGDIIRGVVIDVDDNANNVTVRMGNQRGTLALADMRWASLPDPEVEYTARRVSRAGSVLSAGDVIQVRIKDKDTKDSWSLALEQTPAVQAALLCMEAGTGEVRAMIGGRDFFESHFNRAIQSRRQPGSAFKPIIYAAALDKGFTPATGIVDSPIVFADRQTDILWKPENYDRTFHGLTLFRDGLIFSRNIITVKILREIGIGYAVDYARKFGITSFLDRDLSLSLGSSGMSLLEMVQAYSVFANQGALVPSCFIQKIVDRDGNVVYECRTEPEKVIEESTAYIITHLMEEVVKSGTGRRVRALNRPVAGKTGTTNQLNDAWFVGYTPEYITGVWVGFDDQKPLGKNETGARAASPIWLDFMQQALKGKPVRTFPVPDSVVFARIDVDTGLLPVPETRRTIFECFKEGSAPTQYSRRSDQLTETDDFFKQDM